MIRKVLLAMICLLLLGTATAYPLSSWKLTAPIISLGVTDLTTNLVGWWSCNENTGTEIADSSGNSNTGTLTNATWTAGNYGSCLSFNGTTAFVTIPDSKSLQFGGATTVALWINPTSVNAAYRFLSKRDAGGTQFDFMCSNANTLAIYNGNETTQSAACLTTGWQHIAVVNSSGDNTLTFYRNGSIVTQVGPFMTISANDAPLLIGKDYTGIQYFYGLIDEIPIFSRGLTPTEIDDLYDFGGVIPSTSKPQLMIAGGDDE